ncbi:hypothetical protein KI387_041157 [Taxus chinensis]|uniref:Uncharacterized protein n=1 Tax=Taxus chinensis TaxID=29808 RepID=A0AA38FA31_TAXCH|nr:hypothetical protein KI387_041157 [Taxus chinensis]
MVITLKKIPGKERTNPYKIPIPNPIFPLDGSVEICLIINDGEKKVSRVSSEFAKAKVKEEGLPISKILKFSKLKTDYKPFEAKRKLCGSFDMFMADRSVIPLLPKYLGKSFYKKKKHPIPIDLSHKQWRRQIELSCSCALVFMPSRRGFFKIKGVGSGDGLQVLAVEPEKKGEDDRDSEKEGGKKTFKKGMIHNVRYMDNMLEDSSNGLLGDTDQNEGFLGDEDRNVGLLGNEEQNDGPDENREEIDLPVFLEARASKIYSGDNESNEGLLKSSKKNRSGKKVAGAKRRKDLSLEGKVSSLSDGDINESTPYSDSTPVSQHRKRSKSIYSDVPVAVSVKALPKKGNAKILEDRVVSNNVKGSATKGKTKHREDGAVTDSAKKRKGQKNIEDGAVNSNFKASATKGKTKHYEDGWSIY